MSGDESSNELIGIDQRINHSDGSQSTSHHIIEEIRRMESSLSSSIRTVSDRVDRLSETVYGPPPAKRRPAEPVSLNWSDRCDCGIDGLPAGPTTRKAMMAMNLWHQGRYDCQRPIRPSSRLRSPRRYPTVSVGGYAMPSRSRESRRLVVRG